MSANRAENVVNPVCLGRKVVCLQLWIEIVHHEHLVGGIQRYHSDWNIPGKDQAGGVWIVVDVPLSGFVGRRDVTDIPGDMHCASHLVNF